MDGRRWRGLDDDDGWTMVRVFESLRNENKQKKMRREVRTLQLDQGMESRVFFTFFNPVCHGGVDTKPEKASHDPTVYVCWSGQV